MSKQSTIAPAKYTPETHPAWCVGSTSECYAYVDDPDERGPHYSTEWRLPLDTVNSCGEPDFLAVYLQQEVGGALTLFVGRGESAQAIEISLDALLRDTLPRVI